MRIRSSNPGGRLNTIEPGHVDVHHNDRGLQLCHRQHSLFAIRRLADNLEMGIGGENRPERLPNLLHVIHEEDSDDLSSFAFHESPPCLRCRDENRVSWWKVSGHGVALPSASHPYDMLSNRWGSRGFPRA